MKKILFGVPEKFSLDALYPPVGLLYLAAMARNYGYNVKVIDAQIVGEETLLREFVRGNYNYFGTTILTPLRENSYTLIRKIKKANSHCQVMVGGAHVSIMPEQTLRHVPEIDIVVVGEGEQTLIDILMGKDWTEIPGVWYRRKGLIEHTGWRSPMDVTLIPTPAWDLIDSTKYRAYEDVVIDGIPYARQPFLTIYSSRGCSGSCSFCSTWSIWHKWRQIRPEKIVDEIEILYKYGIVHFFIADDSMINDEKFVHRFSDELLTRKITIKYKIACRADKITSAVVNSLKRSGCYEVHIGFESGSQKILDSIGKKLTVKDNIRAARLVREAGLRVYALMLIGSIQETIETINETIEFLNQIKPDAVISMDGLMLLPGTRDYRMAIKDGIISDEFWLGKEPFLYYTKNFSKKNLSLLHLAVFKQRRIWSRNLLDLQLFLFYPVEYIKIMKDNSRLGNLIHRFLFYLFKILHRQS